MAAHVEYYTGFWTNWSGGRVAGATLTLNLQQGAYLVAFLALYVRLVGTHAWQLLSYLAFRTKAPPSNFNDILNKHQLLILRNTPSDFTAGWELAKAAWKDRNHSKKVFTRSILLILTATFHGAAFAAAGILASRVTSAQSEVLLRSDVCGIWRVPGSAQSLGQISELVKFDAKQVKNAMKSMQFIAECDSKTSQASCNTYGRKLLNYTVSTHTICPFDSAMCSADTVVRLDSGFVDSLFDLGINTRPSDRVTFRKITECSPLATDGFTKTYTDQNLSKSIAESFEMDQAQSIQGSAFTGFYYGESLYSGQKPTFVFDNSTFDTSSVSVGIQYITHTESAHFGINGTQYSSFQPIPQLRQPSGAFLLFFLAKNVFYSSPVADPWFKAEERVPPGPSSGLAFTQYISRPRTSVLGCTATTEVCNPVSGEMNNCTALMKGLEVDDIGQMSQRLGLNAIQTNVLSRFEDTIWNDIDIMLEGLQGSELLAFRDVEGSFGTGLPDNQWILELENIFSILLTYVQIRVVQYVTGMETSAYNRYLQSPTPGEQWMCDNQIVQRSEHASFSVLGLAIILVVGGLIMVVNSCLSTLWPKVRPHTALGEYRDVQWESNELLELQPRSIEGAKQINDDKFCRSSIASSSRDRLLSTIKSITPSSWQTKDSDSESSMQNDLKSCRSASVATIDMQLQHNDFPPRELADLLATGR